MRIKHTPILLKESVDNLISDPDGLYLDCTFGRGGHTKKILDKLSSKGQLVSFDLDDSAMEAAKNIKHENFRFIKTNFSKIDEFIKDNSLTGVLIDCGVSSPQLDEPQRGFSFQKKGPLDMRFNQKQKITCKDVIEKFSEKEISTILWKFGEEKESRKIAKSIVKYREKNAINNTLDLAEIIKAAKTIKTKKHPATKSFQALRMAVNSEIENLSVCLEKIKDKLIKSGKLVIISFPIFAKILSICSSSKSIISSIRRCAFLEYVKNLSKLKLAFSVHSFSTKEVKLTNISLQESYGDKIISPQGFVD